MHRIAILAASILICNSIAVGQVQQPSPIFTPDEAAKKIDQQVTVEMLIASTGGNRNRYLNSTPDFSRRDNFATFIPETAVRKFVEAKIEKPEEYYYGKVIQVTGTVTLARDKPQIAVTDPSQIKIIEQ